MHGIPRDRFIGKVFTYVDLLLLITYTIFAFLLFYLREDYKPQERCTPCICRVYTRVTYVISVMYMYSVYQHTNKRINRCRSNCVTCTDSGELLVMRMVSLIICH